MIWLSCIKKYELLVSGSCLGIKVSKSLVWLVFSTITIQIDIVSLGFSTRNLSMF